MLCAVELAEILYATGGEFITNRVTQFQSRTVRRKLITTENKELLSVSALLYFHLHAHMYLYLTNISWVTILF